MLKISKKNIEEIKYHLNNIENARTNINKQLYFLSLNEKADEYRKSIQLRYGILIRIITNIFKIYCKNHYLI